MAGINSTWTIKSEYRPCYVGEKRALFHCWAQTSSIHKQQSRTDCAGIMTEVFALCEFEDGTVKKVKTQDICFTDGDFEGYTWRKK